MSEASEAFFRASREANQKIRACEQANRSDNAAVLTLVKMFAVDDERLDRFASRIEDFRASTLPGLELRLERAIDEAASLAVAQSEAIAAERRVVHSSDALAKLERIHKVMRPTRRENRSGRVSGRSCRGARLSGS